MPSSKLPKSALLIAVVAMYSLAHLTWYLDTPLGISPVLDGQENLILSQQIQDGTLAREPFFRAMLYPALLSILPIGHSLLGLLCHLLNTTLSIHIARRFWRSERAGLITGILVGFNPVLLHFAFDPLDTTIAISLFLAALSTLQSAYHRSSYQDHALRLYAATGLLISLATLARPHFLLCLLVIALLLSIGVWKKRSSIPQLASYFVACLVPILAYGFVQLSFSGSFQILPWQGAYNLWISNNEQANGLYYQQTISFKCIAQIKNGQDVLFRSFAFATY